MKKLKWKTIKLLYASARSVGAGRIMAAYLAVQGARELGKFGV